MCIFIVLKFHEWFFFFFKQKIRCMAIITKTMVWQLLCLVKWLYWWLSLIWKWNYFVLKFFMLSHYFASSQLRVLLFFFVCFMFKPLLYISNQSVFNTAASVDYVYRLYSHTDRLCHTWCLCGTRMSNTIHTFFRAPLRSQLGFIVSV